MWNYFLNLLSWDSSLSLQYNSLVRAAFVSVEQALDRHQINSCVANAIVFAIAHFLFTMLQTSNAKVGNRTIYIHYEQHRERYNLFSVRRICNIKTTNKYTLGNC